MLSLAVFHSTYQGTGNQSTQDTDQHLNQNFEGKTNSLATEVLVNSTKGE